MTDSGGEIQWYFSQVKGTMEDEVNEADIISTVEFNEDGELLATGDKGGRIVIFQREQPTKAQLQQHGYHSLMHNNNLLRTEYNVYSTFQSHEAEFDYLKSLEIEEKINKIKWLKRKNMAHFLLSTNDKTVKLWKIRERNKRAIIASSSSTADPTMISTTSSSSSSSTNITQLLNGNTHINIRDDYNSYIRSVSIPVVKYMDRIEVEALPKRIFANAHTYHINSISLNSDQETFMSADDLRINLWHIEITNQSFNIVDIKPANMEELTEVITAAEFHPKECNLFVYSSSKGIIRLCDMRQSALCDTQAKIFEEREDPTTKNFFSEIISSISDVKFSHSGRYLCTRDYLNVKIWDLNMENRPVETYCVHDYLRNKLCILYENDCIFDKFECSWSSNDDQILSGSYNNLFKSFNRNTKQELMFECTREQSKPRQLLKQKRVINSALTNGVNNNSTSNSSTNNGSSSPCLNTKRNNLMNGTKLNATNASTYKDEINVDNLDFTKKILHTSWHPKDNIIAIAATNNLYLFYNKQETISVGTSNGTLATSTNHLSSSSTTSTASTASTNCYNSEVNGINCSGGEPIEVQHQNSSPSLLNKGYNMMNNSSEQTNGILSDNEQPSNTTPSLNASTNNNQITLNTSFYTTESTQQQQQQQQSVMLLVSSPSATVSDSLPSLSINNNINTTSTTTNTTPTPTPTPTTTTTNTTSSSSTMTTASTTSSSLLSSTSLSSSISSSNSTSMSL